MAEEASAQATNPPATAAAPAADNASLQPGQVDLADLSLEKLDTLYETGSVGLDKPEGSDGGVKAGTTTPPAEATPPVAETTTETAAPPVTTELEKKPEGEIPPVEAAPVETATPPETTETVPPEDPEEIKGIQRPRLKDPDDQQIAAIYKHAKESEKPISWAEAERRVKGDPSAKTEETATTAPQVTNLTEKADTLRGEIATLETQLDEKASEEGVLYDKALKDMQGQLADKKTDLKLLERDIQTQQTEIKSYRVTVRKESTAAAIKSYPDVAKDDSVLGQAIKAEIAKMKADDSPALYDDDAPFAIAAKVASRLGIAPVAPAKAEATTAPKPSSTAAPKPAAPARTVVSPPSGAKTAAPQIAANPQTEAAKTVEHLRKDATLEELDNVFMPDGANSLLFSVAGR